MSPSMRIPLGRGPSSLEDRELMGAAAAPPTCPGLAPPPCRHQSRRPFPRCPSHPGRSRQRASSLPLSLTRAPCTCACHPTRSHDSTSPRLGTRHPWHEVHTTGHFIPVWVQTYLEKVTGTPPPRCHAQAEQGLGHRPRAPDVPTYVRLTLSECLDLRPWRKQALLRERRSGCFRGRHTVGHRSVGLTAVTASCVLLSYPI